MRVQEVDAALQDYDEYLNSGGGSVSPSLWLELGRAAELQQEYERAFCEYEKL